MKRLLIFAMMLTPIAALAQQPQPAAKATAVMRGRVVAADTGRPLARARVSVAPLEPGMASRSVVTGSDGVYEIGELPAGRYTVTASRSGYLTLRSGQRRPLDQARPLQLTEGQVLERIDFLLPRNSVIGGRITDETGEAIADARVFILRARFVEGKRVLAAVTTASTDDRGEYRVSVDPGVYFALATLKQVWVVIDGGEEQTIGYAPTYSPGTPNAANAQRITVGVGQAAGADFSMIRARAANISGIAVDSMARPLTGQTVFYGEDARTVDGAQAYAGGGVLVGADGRFTLKNLAPGTYKLVMRYVTGDGNAMHVHEALSEVVSVDGRDVGDLRLVTSRGWSLTGQVTGENGAAPDLPNSRKRIIGVPSSPDADLKVGGIDDSGAVKDDGTFTVAGLFGPVRIRAVLPAGWTVKSVLLNGRDVTDQPIELGRSDQQRTPIQVVVTNRLTTISGQLIDGSGAPKTDSVVLIFPASAEKWPDESRYIRVVRPDQQGQFQIRGLPAGEYLAAAFEYLDEGTWNDPEYLNSIRRFAQRIELGDGGSQAITLRVGP